MPRSPSATLPDGLPAAGGTARGPQHQPTAAEADLAEIWAYLATEASEAVATRFVRQIEAAFEPVRYFPLAAPARERLAARRFSRMTSLTDPSIRPPT